MVVSVIGTLLFAIEPFIQISREKGHNAFLWPSRAYEEHASLLFIKQDKDLVDLHSDPRFSDLLRRMDLPQ